MEHLSCIAPVADWARYSDGSRLCVPSGGGEQAAVVTGVLLEPSQVRTAAAGSSDFHGDELVHKSNEAKSKAGHTGRQDHNEAEKGRGQTDPPSHPKQKDTAVLSLAAFHVPPNSSP